MSDNERRRELNLLSLTKRRLREDPLAASNYFWNLNVIIEGSLVRQMKVHATQCLQD